MKLEAKTIIGFVLIAVVSYLCRPLNDKIADVFIGSKNDKDMETSDVVNEEISDEIHISGNIEGHDYVDLGLSVKWATCNIGANNPEEYGGYFAWGETETKDNYDEDHYSWTSDDAAVAQWGGSWRMPTKVEWDELLEKCSWERTTVNRVKGYKITAKNGNWIFLPAAGSRNGTSGYYVGSDGSYWSSAVDESYSNDAYSLYFDSSSKSSYRYYRYRGRSVRPVSE